MPPPCTTSAPEVPSVPFGLAATFAAMADAQSYAASIAFGSSETVSFAARLSSLLIASSSLASALLMSDVSVTQAMWSIRVDSVVASGGAEG